MIDTNDIELDEFLDYVTNTKKPDVYCIYDTATGFSITGDKAYVKFALDSLMEYQHEYNYTIKLASREQRNVDDEIVLALVENVIYQNDRFMTCNINIEEGVQYACHKYN